MKMIKNRNDYKALLFHQMSKYFMFYELHGLCMNKSESGLNHHVCERCVMINCKPIMMSCNPVNSQKYYRGHDIRVLKGSYRINLFGIHIVFLCECEYLNTLYCISRVSNFCQRMKTKGYYERCTSGQINKFN